MRTMVPMKAKGEDTWLVEILKGSKRGNALSKSCEVQPRSHFTKQR
jgi:hypothetical protein